LSYVRLRWEAGRRIPPHSRFQNHLHYLSPDASHGMSLRSSTARHSLAVPIFWDWLAARDAERPGEANSIPSSTRVGCSKHVGDPKVAWASGAVRASRFPVPIMVVKRQWRPRYR
jgi:hypothetical protein